MACVVRVVVGRSILCGAVMALNLNFAPNPFSRSDLINWTLGSVANRSLADVATTAPLILIGCALLASERANLSLLSLGEAAAVAHGLDARRTRIDRKSTRLNSSH